MKLLVISEGKHELGGALEALVRRLTGLAGPIALLKVSDPALRVHSGKGPGYFKKAIRCLLYAEENGFDGLVFLIDQDDQPDRKRQISDAQDDVRLTTLPRAMGVAVHMFDAWMLADEKALTSILGSSVQCQPDPEKIRDPKETCISLRDGSGITLQLHEMYAELAKVIDLNLLANRCPVGFAPFQQRVSQLCKRLTQ